MATRRMLPTKFFKDPDVIALSTNDIRLILVGLVLFADDEGRELAHAKLLGREFDFAPEVVEQALEELEANDFLQCYRVGRHRYYSLCRWYEWETLSKPTPSKYPPPPPLVETRDATAAFVSLPLTPLGNPGNARAILSEEEGEEKGKQEQKREDEEERQERTMYVSAPLELLSTSQAPALSLRKGEGNEQELQEKARHVASILHLPQNEALMRIVAEYSSDSTLSLLGEADAAREYIDDCQRNRHSTQMTPSFFRRWLKREHDSSLRRRIFATPPLHQPLDGEMKAKTSLLRAGLPPSLMHLEASYLGERGGVSSVQRGGNGARKAVAL